MKRFLILCGLAALLSAATATGQAVATSQRESVSADEFASPMVIEAPFVLADPARWSDVWSLEKEYADLARFHCERVFIESLRMRARRADNDVLAVTVKIKLRNPNGNHDKRAFLTVELQNDGIAVNQVALPKSATERSFGKAQAQKFGPLDGGIDLEESDSATKTTFFGVLAADLNPNTTMKITLSLRND